MKANELMVGDWVMFNNNPIKVENIYDDSINFYPDIPYVQEEYMIDESDIEPIPLTQEILKKNGFAKNKYQEYTVPTNSEAEIYLVIDNEHGVCLSGYDSIVFIHCQYVHELQHALKLCKTNKEIEL